LTDYAADGSVTSKAIASISLLTLSAQGFFEKLGFSKVERAQLPEPLKRSTQLAIPACSTAVAMTLEFFKTTDEQLANSIAAELAEHGTLVPPWIKYPDIPRYSIGWRMGSGEWYAWMMGTWLESLAPEEVAAYKAKWPPPDDWADYWDPEEDEAD
jgi:hypothetical protein